MSLKSRNLRYLDCVELFTPLNEVGELGYPTDGVQSLGIHSANVERLDGSRALYFQSLGYSYPIVIRMYDPATAFSTIVWNGVTAIVKSVTPSKVNTDCVVVYADLKTDNP